MAQEPPTSHAQNPATQPTNPLVTARLAKSLTVLSYARYLGVHKSLIQFSEQGCYRKIPPPYFRANAVDYYVAPELYHKFRIAKRLRNSQHFVFPVEAPDNFAELLEFLQLNPYQFACKFCVQPTEVQKLSQGIRSRLPLNLQEALIQIGLPYDWVKDLERNLKRA